ncbi:MAG: HEAT repeat domain-containing protein [Planctomycetaceae bacterium]|nr:MAG: HEAT repeat domain-containing protein [Planctomycetaceae bacterium]
MRLVRSSIRWFNMVTTSQTLVFNRLIDTEVVIRRNAIRELLAHSSAITGLTAVVVRLVADRDEAVRATATECLEKIVKPGVEEVTELTTLLRETCDGEVEYWAATMLGRIGFPAERSVGALASVLLDSPCLAARERAAWALGQIGPGARAALNALRQIGHDDPPRLRRLAETAINTMNQRAA